MRLYIPTCTLNFNNIFSTESISPASFYAKRGFGNKRYYKVEANGIDNAIMLYSKYPIFKVENGDLENGPMVIEIETESCPDILVTKVKEKNGVDVYASSSTIYLNPFNCFVYFDSYQDLQTILTKSEQSLENKYSKLYHTNLKVHQKKSWSITSLFSEKEEFNWDDSFLRDVEQIPVGNNEKDIFIDRLKGCLICYLIGANSSVSPEVGRLKQLARKLRNTLSAVVNSPEHKPTEIQDELLVSSIREFNSIFSKLDENHKYNSLLLEKSLVSPSTGLSREILQKVLSDLRLTDIFQNRLNLKPVYNANDLYNCLYAQSMSDSYLYETNRMNDAIKRIEISEQASRVKLSLSELLSVDGLKITLKDSKVGKGSFFPALLESQMRGEYKHFMDDNNVEEPLAVAFVGGAKLKTLINDWDGSKFQKYINGLLANLQKGEAFDVFSNDEPIMQSFAAFCQKGEDIDRLSDYMLQLGFADYQFALAIYGATRGFASLPKTFTSRLLRVSDYYVDFFRQLNKLLFNFEFGDIQFPKYEESAKATDYTSEISTTIISKINQIEPKVNKQEKVVQAVAKSAFLENQVQSPKAFMYIADNILGTKTNAYRALKSANFENDSTQYSPESFRKKIFSIVESSLPTSKKTRNETISKIDKIIELEAKRQDYNAFIFILDNFMNSSDPAYKKIVRLVTSSSTPIVTSSHLNFETQNIHSSYPKDLPKINVFLSMPENVQRRLEQNWLFTQKQYTNNRAEHIRYFINLCKKEGRGEAHKQTSLNGIFDERIASQVEKELHIYYNV